MPDINGTFFNLGIIFYSQEEAIKSHSIQVQYIVEGNVYYKMDKRFLPYTKTGDAEVFNNLTNTATGVYSHAEGFNESS